MARKNFGCGDPLCKSSTGICESATFGKGELDSNGYWEFPCTACEQHWMYLYPSRVWEDWETKIKNSHVIEVVVKPKEERT